MLHKLSDKPQEPHKIAWLIVFEDSSDVMNTAQYLSHKCFV